MDLLKIIAENIIVDSLSNNSVELGLSAKQGKYLNEVKLDAPNKDGLKGQVLGTDGNGTMSWVDINNTIPLEEIEAAVSKYMKQYQENEIKHNSILAFQTIQQMKAYEKLTSGCQCITFGYYTILDGGGGFYNIRNKRPDDVDDGGGILFCANDLVAVLMVFNNRITMPQLGYFPNIETQDCHDVIQVYVNLCNRNNVKYELFFPSGRWFFSETNIHNGRKGVVLTGISNQVGTDAAVYLQGESAIMPFREGQQYIWNFGKSIDSRELTSGNIIHNFTIATGWRPDAVSYCKNFCKFGIVLTTCCYSDFDGLYFHYFQGTALCIQTGWENRFGYLNFRCTGYTEKDFTYPAMWIKQHPTGSTPSAVSACYWDYINFEGITGTCIYSTEPNFVHCEFNNIQVEWSAFGARNSEITNTQITIQDIPRWNDPSDKIEHLYIFKGCSATGYNPIMFNTISISGGNLTGGKFSWKDEANEEHYRWVVKSGVFGMEEVYNNPRGGFKALVSKLSSLGDLPVYHCVDTCNKSCELIVSSLMPRKENVFLTNNIRAGALIVQDSYTVQQKIQNYPNRIYMGQVLDSISLASLNDNSGINGLVHRPWGSEMINVMVDGTKRYVYRLYLKYMSIEEVPDKIITSATSVITTTGAVMMNGIEIVKQDITNGRYPLNQWFDYEAPFMERLPVAKYLVSVRFCKEVYIDYIEEVQGEPRTVTKNQLIGRYLTKSSKGATIFCRDVKESQDGPVGLMTYFDGSIWRTYSGTPVSNLIQG